MIRISGGTSERRYLIALPTRLTKTCSSCDASAITAGSGSTVTIAPASRIGVSSARSAPFTTAPASVGSSGFAPVSIRETWSRSWIRVCIRLPPSTMKPMNSSASVSSFPLYRRSRSWLKLTIDRSGSCRSWRGDVREPLQFLVRALKILGRAGQREFGRLPLGDVAGDAQDPDRRAPLGP